MRTKTAAPFIAIGIAAVACGPEPDAEAPHPSTAVLASSSPAAPSATAIAAPSASGPSCESLATTIASAEARLAKPTYSCTSDADCECYGGPVCPNTISGVCPKVIGVGAQRELTALESTWRQAGCGGYVWSPSQCRPACRGGTCSNLKGRRDLTDAEIADRCGFKGNQICCLGPPTINPPPKPLCYSAGE